MTHLIGIHDIEGAAISPAGTWILDTIALSENPEPRHYEQDAPGREIIARINWGYGSTGTLPLPARYDEFVLRLVAHVTASSGCHRWVIGNEPNLPREWPDGQPIFPWHYAACYRLCRSAIHTLPGHGQDEVLVAAPGPWNPDLRYEGNANGDWITYFGNVLALLGVACDGFSLHSYTHGYHLSLVTSSARMQAPFQHRHYEFRTYRDYLEVIPPFLSTKPVYITEANGNGPWQAVGLMPSMLNEIDNWNKGGGQAILAVLFYRYPKYDENATFAIEGKADVIAEYQNALARGYPSPVAVTPRPTPPAAPAPAPVTTHLPTVLGGQPGGTAVPQTAPALIWDTRLDQRGIKLTPYVPQPGELYWKVVRGDYWLEKEHIFVDTLDINGNKLVGVNLRRWWGNGGQDEQEIKTTALVPERWMADFPMFNAGWSYGLEALGHPSDRLWGMGLGTWENPEWTIHLSYKFRFRLVLAPLKLPEPIVPPPPAPPILVPVPVRPLPGGAALLTWPCKGVISQRWGSAPDYYQSQLGIPYHNGTDIAAPAGTEAKAMAAGIVAYVGSDKNYGNYVRVWHESYQLHTFLAHLLTIDVAAGQRVTQGQVLGKVGATGLATGPHIHVEVRLGAKDTYAQGTLGHGSGRVDPETVMYLLNSLGQAQGGVGEQVGLPVLAAAAAREFGVDVPLFLRLVDAESAWEADALSPAGAVGLAQLMPATFEEWAGKVGATYILDPRDNLRVGAAYLAFLFKYYKGNAEQAVTAYNWGLGNVDAGGTPPAETKRYVREVVYNQE